jgi:hypothetical protein
MSRSEEFLCRLRAAYNFATVAEVLKEYEDVYEYTARRYDHVNLTVKDSGVKVVIVPSLRGRANARAHIYGETSENLKIRASGREQLWEYLSKREERENVRIL